MGQIGFCEPLPAAIGISVPAVFQGAAKPDIHLVSYFT